MKNREVYVKDPGQNRLLNDGVAEVTDGRSDAEMATLRYELETFVCDGEYAKGMRRILDTFLRNIDQPTQPGVWVSGFYGSGKSHLVKMLRALWIDLGFSDGATARGLVDVPTDVGDQLKELSTVARRLGSLHAVSGDLRNGTGVVRLDVLNLVFKSAGLPEQYPLARFVMWLRDEGYLDDVRARVEAAGKQWNKELRNLYVSPHVAQALLDVHPGFARSPDEVGLLLKEQFPKTDDVTTEQMTDAMRDALMVNGKLPLTLIALDEVQQYIDGNQDRTELIRKLTETCCKHFGGRLLFVGTGQTALSGTPMLQKLMGRYTVRIELSDTDVETVIRKVILAKKADRMPAVEKVLTEHLGEISRHLEGTKVAHRPDDRAALVPDYPLLPVRRRFWERVLRAVDPGGTGSQLRNQLKVVHEAARTTADQGLGCVVAGDFIYDQIAASLLQTGVLPREIYEFIKETASGSPDGDLKARICGLIFLIGKLPREVGGGDLGIGAKVDVLADLLVTDLRAGSAELRRRIPDALAELEESGKVMRVGDEYRMQTRESSAWNDEYRSQIAAVFGDPQRVGNERADLLRNECGKRLKGTKGYQGECKEQRTITPHFGPEAPKDAAKAIHVWVRDGWEDDDKVVLADARAAGNDSPTIFVFIPRRTADEIKKTLGSLRAAEATLNIRGVPSGSEAEEAYLAMTTRKGDAERRLASLIDEVFAGARVFQGGGQEVFGNDLATKVATAAEGSVVRLYPQFDAADHPKWNKVIDRARKGDGGALEAVDHTEEVGKHAVPAAILKFVGSGKKGAEIRKQYDDSPYGWPRDAIDGGIYALVQSGDLRAMDADNKVLDAKGIDRAKLNQIKFRVESVTVGAPQRIKVRKLLQDVGITCKPNEELAGIAKLLEVLRERAASAGGEAPRPDAPSVTHLDELGLKAGNEQIVAIYERREELADQAQTWKQTGDQIAERLPRWTRLQKLLGHATGQLAEAADLKTQFDAIRDQRLLLANPDPVPGLCDQVTKLLRDALTTSQADYQAAHESGMETLKADDNWVQLTPEQKNELLVSQKLTKVPQVDTSTESNVLESLDGMPLSTWSDRIAALPSRFDKVRLAAAELMEPEAVYVKIPSRTLKTPDEVRDWVQALEKDLLAKLETSTGPVVVH